MNTTLRNALKLAAISGLIIASLPSNTASARISLDPAATAADKAAYQEAIGYLSKSTEARRVIEVLQNSQNDYKIVFGARLALDSNLPGNEYDPATRTVYWIPTYGFQWKKTFSPWCRITPALGLIHEMGHASHQELDHASYQKDARNQMVVWGTREEKRTILEIENVVAKELGEPLRKEHNVSLLSENSGVGYFQTRSSSTIQPATATFANL